MSYVTCRCNNNYSGCGTVGFPYSGNCNYSNRRSHSGTDEEYDNETNKRCAGYTDTEKYSCPHRNKDENAPNVRDISANALSNVNHNSMDILQQTISQDIQERRLNALYSSNLTNFVSSQTSGLVVRASKANSLEDEITNIRNIVNYVNDHGYHHTMIYQTVDNDEILHANTMSQLSVEAYTLWKDCVCYSDCLAYGEWIYYTCTCNQNCGCNY